MNGKAMDKLKRSFSFYHERSEKSMVLQAILCLAITFFVIVLSVGGMYWCEIHSRRRH